MGASPDIGEVADPRPRRSTARRRAVAGAVAVGVFGVAAIVETADAQPEPTGFAELAVGEWFGNGRAGGITTSEEGGLAVAFDGDFTTNLEFAVDVDGSLSGSWILDGASVASFSAPQLTFQDVMTHTASGPMAGNARQFSLGTAQITTNHNVVGDISFAGTSNDPVGPIDLAVEGIYCNDAWGAWIMSWNFELESQSYTPSFDGEWHAVRQSAEFSDREGELLRQLSELYNELGLEIRDLENQPATAELGTVLPADTFWEYIYRLVDLYNAIRNLTACDRALIGEEQIEQWLYNITATLSTFVEFLLAQYDLGADELTELIALATAAGVIGDGSQNPDSDRIENELDDELTDVVNDSSASASDRLSAAATRWQHGWPLE